MDIEKVRKLLNTIGNDPKVKQMINDAMEAKTDADMIRVWAEIAPKLGIEVTEDEIRIGIEALIKERMQKTEEGVKQLSDIEVEKAAGGGQNPNCKYDFINKENCVAKDGCDRFYQDYDNYICKNTYNGHSCEHIDYCSCDIAFLCEGIVLNNEVLSKCPVNYSICEITLLPPGTGN